MRFALTVVLWLATTVALAVAVPAGWAQLNIVDEDGYAAFARKAAGDPDLQSAAAAELSTRAMALIETKGAHGGAKHPVESAEVHEIASAFTAGPSFPPLFADANRAAHRYLFSLGQLRRCLGDRFGADAERQRFCAGAKQPQRDSARDADDPADGVAARSVGAPGAAEPPRRLGSLGEPGCGGRSAVSSAC